MTRPLPEAAEAALSAPATGSAAQAPLQPQPSTGTPDEQQAAKRVQAAYRGHMERRSSHGLALHKDSDKAWFGVVDELTGNASAGKSKWRRVTQDASIVGRGSAASGTSLLLKKEHWLEATDRQHRYGSNLAPYHAAWTESPSPQSFFHWLDAGEGADLELPEVPRSKLASETLHYCSCEERAVTAAEYCSRDERDATAAEVGAGGLLRYVGTGEPVHTLSAEDSGMLAEDPEAWRSLEQAAAAMARGGDANASEEEKKAMKQRRNRNKWIFVTTADMKQFYIAAKEKGRFQHSSFLAGGAVGAAGQISVDHGRIVKMAPMSGHYVPSLSHYIAFLDRLADLGVDLSEALLLNPFEEEPPPGCRHELRRATLAALDDKERH